VYLVAFEVNGSTEIGVMTADKKHVIPLAAAEAHYWGKAQLPSTMVGLIEQGDAALEAVRAILAKAEADSACPKLSLPEVRLKAPIPRPARNIFCIGKNYREHAMEFDKTADPDIAIPKFPVVFTKAPTVVIGPNDIINSHSRVTSALDYEVELAVVIGKRGTYIPEDQAMDYIFGYTIFNDVTARDLQKRHLQWFRGKSLDTFGPMGPYLVHKSVVPNPADINVTSKVNGELRQQANTRDFIFNIPTLIATISAGLTLEPGDIIATGTPAGVGAGFNPPRFLKPGDEVELEVSYLGVLKNTVG
jgi:2-keto-4-pentenoate hydratase/2-oxohepta-3-ene-1,7-dioic acid hydratase in catechol pathway